MIVYLAGLVRLLLADMCQQIIYVPSEERNIEIEAFTCLDIRVA